MKSREFYQHCAAEFTHPDLVHPNLMRTNLVQGVGGRRVYQVSQSADGLPDGHVYTSLIDPLTPEIAWFFVFPIGCKKGTLATAWFWGDA